MCSNHERNMHHFGRIITYMLRKHLDFLKKIFFDVTV